jgi:cyanophycinase
MSAKAKGTLIIIGGHENKDESEGEMVILEEVAARARDGLLVIVTVASQQPEQLAKEYRAVFQRLKVKRVEALELRERADGHDEELLKLLDDARVVFFTGGDQLRITSQIGDTPIFRHMQRIYQQGGTIVGTSAGAAAMPETMLVSGPGDTSARISGMEMAPGLGLLSDAVVDSHFAERGRIGRLLGAVTQNPRNLGIGIDEDTAIVVERGERFRVLGSGAVYVADGADISYSSLSERQPEGVVTIHDVRLHVLADGDRFDLRERRPIVEQAGRKERNAA